MNFKGLHHYKKIIILRNHTGAEYGQLIKKSWYLLRPNWGYGRINITETRSGVLLNITHIDRTDKEDAKRERGMGLKIRE